MKLIIFGKVSEEELADRELLIELVLNGIGGNTLAEAELNISHKELMEWRAYRQKYGSFLWSPFRAKLWKLDGTLHRLQS